MIRGVSMGDTLREYSGFLLFSPLPKEVHGKIIAAARSYGLEVDLGESQLEFSYTGRNSNRFVESFLRDLAALLVSAEGEITCEQDVDGEISFVFYSIEGGELFRQAGRLQRGEKERVRPSIESSGNREPGGSR